MQAYKVLTWISLGLQDGRTLLLRPQDYMIAQWLSTGTVEAVANAKADRLAQADAALAPIASPVAASFTVDGIAVPVDERQFPLPASAFDPPDASRIDR
jgi:hypothetical protein